MAQSMRFMGCLLVAACASRCATTAASSDGQGTLDTMPADQAIPALTQQLMDALPGDVTVWRRYLSARAVYVSEAGEVASKEELLEAFAPFPQGLVGSIEVRNPRVTDFGDVAVSVFDAHEKQTVYDQQIEVSYRSTHTWRREDGRWRLIAAQNLVLAKDPPALPIDTGRLADYAGTYELSGQRRYRIEQRGDSLVGGRENSELTPLIAVGDNVFVDAGSNLGILRIFVRGPAGAVERMVQRRKFADLDWLKVSDGAPNQ
jgi:ketosteroid isomerase-like protein